MKVLLHYKRKKAVGDAFMSTTAFTSKIQTNSVLYHYNEKTLSLKFDDANVMKVFLCVNWQFCLSYFNLDAVSPIEEGCKT